MSTFFHRLSSLLALPLFASIVHAQQTRTLLATPSTMAWGYYWSQAKSRMVSSPMSRWEVTISAEDDGANCSSKSPWKCPATNISRKTRSVSPVFSM
jgi:hypothetical protein